MSAYFTLTLDTTAPTSGSISLPDYASSTSVTATISATGATYMKIYGDVAASASSSTAISESDATWVAYATSANIYLTTGDATKTVYIKFKDDVGNVSSAASDTCVLDTSAPEVTITGPDVATISKVSGYNVSTFSFSADEAFVQWTVRVVPSSSSDHTAGTEIPTTGGSTNTSGSTATAASTAVTVKIYGADFETAAGSEGAHVVKVFVKDANGNWSV